MRRETRIVAEAEKLLLENRRTVGGHTFTIPSRHEYRHQWLWDSCFHAIALRHLDSDVAESELLSLVASQHRNGMIPHESKYSLLNVPLPYTSVITQPPFVARATLDVYEKSQNKKFLEEIFPHLVAYHRWLEEKREKNGVLKVISSLESGEDSSVLWDIGILGDSEIIFRVRELYGAVAAHVPLVPQLTGLLSVMSTSVYADSLECMAKIAGVLGREELKTYYMCRRETVSNGMRRLFRSSDGLYHNVRSTGSLLEYKAHSLFSPMFAGILDSDDAEELVEEHLLNKKEFLTPFPIPTVAVSEPKFSPTEYWRGPMWVNINWMLYRGLKRYKFDDVAEQIRQKTIATINRSGFREYYNPLTGDGLGAKDFGWSTLVVDMMKG